MAKSIQKFISEAPRTVDGYWKGSTNLEGTIRQLLVQPKSPDTIYNIGIIDEDGFILFRRIDVQGNFASEDLNIIMMPGEKFLVIEDADKDEFFRVKVIYQE